MSDISFSGGSRHGGRPVASAVLAGVAAAALSTMLLPDTAKAAACNPPDTLAPVTVDGVTYNLCITLTTNTDTRLITPDTAPWYSNNTALANKLADALAGLNDSGPGIPYAGPGFSQSVPTNGNGGNLEFAGPLFLTQDSSSNILKATAYIWNNGTYLTSDDRWKPVQGQEYYYVFLDAPNGDPVPGPLPLLGAGAAFAWSRRLRLRQRPGGPAPLAPCAADQALIPATRRR